MLLAAGYVVTLVGMGCCGLVDPTDAGANLSPRSRRTRRGPRPGADPHACGASVGGVSALVAAASMISRLAASGTVLRRARAGAAAAATAYLLLTAAGWLRLVANDSLNIDAGYRRLYAMQGTALVALAAAVAWGWTRRRRTRRRVARLVLDLANTPPLGGLRDLLAASLGDQTLARRILAGRWRFGRRDWAAGRGLRCRDPARTGASSGRAAHPPARSPRRPSGGRQVHGGGPPRAGKRTAQGRTWRPAAAPAHVTAAAHRDRGRGSAPA